MRTRTAGSCRTGAPFHGAALRVCCVLAALLLILSSAMAETAPAWEDRLAAAREKYNEKTVHVYIRGQGRDQKGKINVSFYRAGKKYIAICIRESLQTCPLPGCHLPDSVILLHTINITNYFPESTL